MQTNITEKIKRMKKISLKQKNLIGKGSFSNVYRYKIHNNELAIKCFKKERNAMKENAVLEKIRILVPGWPEYYGLKQLDIGSLQNSNLQPIIIQLISSFNQLKPNVNKCISTFHSDILNNFFYSTIVLALFEEQNIFLQKIHSQFNIQPFKFNFKAFCQDCENQGSTLVIMHSNLELNSFFGGVTVPSWNSKEKYSWLFKIEVGEKMPNLHQ